MTKMLDRFRDWRPRPLRPPTRPAVCDAHEVRLPAGGQRPNALVLARGIVRFRGFDLKAIPVSKRPASLRLQCIAWEPFPNAAFAVRLIGDYAEVFAWDRAALARLLEAAGVTDRRWPCYPESVLRGPIADGLRLVAALDGVEAQRGVNGRLAASRWWPALPTPEAWRNFQRGAGIAAQQQVEDVPEPADLPLGPPWDDWIALDKLSVRLPLAEHVAYAALCAVLGIPLVWYGAEAFHAHRALQDIESRLEGAERDAAPAIAARSEALAASAKLRPLLASFGEPTPLSILAAVSRGIPDDGSQVHEFEYRENNVRIVLAPSATLTGSSLVRSFENVGVFREVNVTTGSGGLLTLSARIDAGAFQRSGESAAMRAQAAGTTVLTPASTGLSPAPEPVARRGGDDGQSLVSPPPGAKGPTVPVSPAPASAALPSGTQPVPQAPPLSGSGTTPPPVAPAASTNPAGAP